MSNQGEKKPSGSKYQPLLDALRRSDQLKVTLTFSTIEALLGESLPPSARSKRGWWSNRSKGALQATAWMAAGYLVETIDLEGEQVTFTKPPEVYRVRCIDDTLQWNSELIRALRLHMGLTQAGMAKELGVRQQTVSEWEKGIYAPTRASSKHLTLVAEKAAFRYEIY
ncbi:MAG: helix-turn-helix domain-containing protein [Leptolyngbya sp. BL-A-14]